MDPTPGFTTLFGDLIHTQASKQALHENILFKGGRTAKEQATFTVSNSYHKSLSYVSVVFPMEILPFYSVEQLPKNFIINYAHANKYIKGLYC